MFVSNANAYLNIHAKVIAIAGGSWGKSVRL